MAENGSSKWKSIVPQVIIGALLLFLGRVSNKYILADTPELTYQLLEGDPIETDLGRYYPTTLILTNTGDTPLNEVRSYLQFEGRIVKVTSNLYADKSMDDSLNLRREFRMPKGSYVEMRVTSKGKILDYKISSAEVMGKKPVSSQNQVALSDLLAVLFGLALSIIVNVLIQKNKELVQLRADASKHKSPT